MKLTAGADAVSSPVQYPRHDVRAFYPRQDRLIGRASPRDNHPASFVDIYKGGKGAVRSMEGCLQEISQCCADILRVDVKLTSELLIEPNQTMRITCFAFPN
jgi:hypothetical protein